MPEQHLDGGRFARPVAAQQSVDRSLGDPQVEPIDRTMAVVILGQAMGDDHVGHGSMHLRSRHTPCAVDSVFNDR